MLIINHYWIMFFISHSLKKPYFSSFCTLSRKASPRESALIPLLKGGNAVIFIVVRSLIAGTS